MQFRVYESDEQRAIFDALESSYGFGRVYIVGGAVRDTVLGVHSKDQDIEVHGLSLEQIASVLSRFGKVNTVGQRFGIVKLTTANGEYDFSVPRRDNKIGVGRGGFDVDFDPTMSLHDAARRRDFTFNSMFMNRQGIVEDPYNGIADLQAGILRHTSSAFPEDPTRVMRGMRFCGQLVLRAAKETAQLCRSIVHTFTEIEADMLWAEWEKWALRSVRPSRGLAFLWVTGWIHHFPELYGMTRVPQEPEWHPEGSVWQHTKHVTDRMNDICNRDGITGEQKIIRMFGALLHDVGKPLTTFVNDEGRIVSPGHDEAGVELALTFMERICAPKRFHQPVADIVRYHMRHIANPTAKAARRLAASFSGINKEDWLAIVEADYSGRPPIEPGVPAHAQALYEKMGEAQQSNMVERLVLGRHLIAAGFSPSPLFGKVLNEVYEIQLDEGLSFEELRKIAVDRMFAEMVLE